MVSRANDTLLRRSLLANALFTFLCGGGLVLASSPLAEITGGVASIHLIIIGVVLLLYALDLGRTALGATLPRGRVFYFIVMDALWVAGSAFVLWGVSVPFTPTGRWIVLVIAVLVGFFAVLQYMGMRHVPRKEMETARSA
ncbi:MAG: hypothetical protein ACE5G0_14545 [Rhodothermales bacterium]